MKKLLFKLFAIIVVLAFSVSCNETLVPDENPDDLLLKSANNNKITYVVVLNDVELKAELSKLKGYEKKQDVMKEASAKILKRANVLDGEIEHVFGTALQGFSVKIPPGQLKKLEMDPSVKYIKEDQMISLITPYAKPGEITTTAVQEVPYGITRVSGGATYTGD